MNFYKKFTKNLLEHHPLLWHSKFFQMLVASICCNIVAFLAGYAMMNFDFLMKKGVTDFFFDSNFIYFYVILCIVIIALWALTYFKNNAVKNFYPTSDFYFIKLFFLLYFPFLIFLFGKMSFDFGTMLKATSYMTESELRAEKDRVNMAYPFLGSDFHDYSFQNRSFPKSYDDIHYHIITNAVENNQEQTINYKSLNNNTTFSNIFSSTNFGFIVYTEKYLAFKQHALNDSCREPTFIIDTFINISKWADFGEGKVENFSENFINNNYLSHKEGLDIYYESRDDYDSLYAPKVADWVQHNRKDSIISALQDMKLLCRKYKIENVFNPSEVYNELVKNNFVVSEDIVTQYRSNYSETYSYGYDDVAPADAVETATVVATADATVADHSNDKIPTVYIDRQELKYRMGNVSEAYTMKFFDYFIGLVLAAFALTVFVLGFEFMDRIRFLIMIPVQGVISIASVVFGFGMFSVLKDIVSDESIALITAMIVFGLVYLIAFLGLYRSFLPKRVTSIFFYMAYFGSPFILNLIYGMICYSTKYEVVKCSNNSYEYHIPFNFYVAIVISVLSYLNFTLFIKKYLSKEE